MEEEMHSIASGSNSTMFEANEDTPYTPHQVDRMRRSLRYYFMTPCEKYKAKKRKPWKLVVQLAKIIIVTIQVCALGAQRAEFVDFTSKARISLQHIMFYHWDPTYETLPYPAAIGKYAIYKTPTLIEHLNYAMTNYNITPSIAVGAYGFPAEQRKLQSRTAQLEIISFRKGDIYPHNTTYRLNPELVYEQYTFGPTRLKNGTDVYDIENTLKENNTTLAINKLHQMKLKFTLNAIHIKEEKNVEPFDSPDCLRINGMVLYDNSNHDGQMEVTMNIDLESIDCQHESLYDKDNTVKLAITMGFDIFVILMCFLSLCTCTRSLSKSLGLLQTTKKFFKAHYSYQLTNEETLNFVNFWYIMIIISDVLSITGSGLKIAVTYKQLQLYDATSMLLGTANVLVWLGVLRYFEYFKKYNVLMLTLKRALPDVLRFLMCAGVIYVAFTFCGWLVLGPYHVKFHTVLTSSECLFSLLNGDDMFVTFSILSEQKTPTAIFIFSRVYLYTFICLFIYFILNIFISVIIGTYETIKSYYVDGFPKTLVEKFMDGCCDAPTSPLYSSDGHNNSCLLFSCCNQQRSVDDLSDSVNIIT